MTHEVYYIIHVPGWSWYVHETGYKELQAIRELYPRAKVKIMNRHTHQEYYASTIKDVTGEAREE